MHALVKQFFEMQERKCDLPTFCAWQKLSYNTLKGWKRTKAKCPSIEALDKVLAPLGYQLTIVLRKDAFK